MINMLTGVIQPDACAIRFLGENIVGRAAHAICCLGMGRTFQNLRLFADLSVLDNVMLGRHSRMSNGFLSSLVAWPTAGKQERETRERALQLLDLVGLGHLAHWPAGSLPYGLQRRVELARALCTEPKLLLLDEPSSGLNVEETADMAFWIQDIQHELGVSVLMVEHDMSLVSKVSDRVLAMNQGEVLATGSPREVQADARVVEAYLGTVDDVSSLRRSKA